MGVQGTPGKLDRSAMRKRAERGPERSQLGLERPKPVKKHTTFASRMTPGSGEKGEWQGDSLGIPGWLTALLVLCSPQLYSLYYLYNSSLR